MRERREVEVNIGIVGLALLAVFWLVIIGLGLWLWLRPPEVPDKLRQDVSDACQAYAGLDLSHLAAACVDVGYQETYGLQDPRLQVAPEDLDRPTG